MRYTNPMRTVRIEKVVINIGVGESGEKLIKAENLLSILSGRRPVRTNSRCKIPSWGIKKGDPIGCKVTLRRDAGEEFLRKAFQANDNEIKERSFDKFGNFSFGIHEYIDIPGMKYDPDIGVFGMDITVTMERPGYRVKRRKIKKKTKLPRREWINRQESIEFIQEKFGVKII